MNGVSFKLGAERRSSGGEEQEGEISKSRQSGINF